MGDCLEDFCPGCPFPYGEDERQLVASESNQYIRDPIKFLEANPGQQLLTGSFQPLDMTHMEQMVQVTEAILTETVILTTLFNFDYTSSNKSHDYYQFAGFYAPVLFASKKENIAN
ncbi:hypothetical protein GALMADRAFT_148887 [Galerina marginata CBS 339.88]|uniref:Uncharacterized protein n=1 Tax=Galerina marginata (strain CBS 339.88) TaxID=685588 RepID=A0A067S5P9_GALM3|nr:hypothetical protein GALMADRAFT_148887 [Galerina marginata CBS 339.88]